jgi:chromosome partitioning protein
MKETVTICISSKKGGVAKTTTAVNLAASFVQLGKRTLIIDLDSQGNATDLLGVSQEIAKEKNILQAIEKELPAEEVIVASSIQNLDVIASVPSLGELPGKMAGKFEQDILFSPIFSDSLYKTYDVVIFDTAPAVLDCLYMSAMNISNYYLIPVFADPESAKGIVGMITSAEVIRKKNRMLKPLGLVICKYDKNISTNVKFATKIREIANEAHFPMCQTVIPISASIPGASAATLPVIKWKPNSPVSESYLSLAKELLVTLFPKKTKKVPTSQTKPGASAKETEQDLDMAIEL